MCSEEFKDIIEIDFIKDNIGLWNITFNLEGYELHK